MRTELIVALFMIGVASATSAQSRLFPLPRHVFDRAPAGAGHSTLTGTADYLADDSLGPRILQDGDGAAAIYPRTDVRGPPDAIGPGANMEERVLGGATVGAATELLSCSDAGYHCARRGRLVGAGVWAAIGAGVGALFDGSVLREWARERVRLRGRQQ